jgi:hypothetical protein
LRSRNGRGAGSISTSAGKAVEGLLKPGPAEDPGAEEGAGGGAGRGGGPRLEDACCEGGGAGSSSKSKSPNEKPSSSAGERARGESGGGRPPRGPAAEAAGAGRREEPGAARGRFACAVRRRNDRSVFWSGWNSYRNDLYESTIFARRRRRSDRRKNGVQDDSPKWTRSIDRGSGSKSW